MKVEHQPALSEFVTAVTKGWVTEVYDEFDQSAMCFFYAGQMPTRKQVAEKLRPFITADPDTIFVEAEESNAKISDTEEIFYMSPETHKRLQEKYFCELLFEEVAVA